ncbi:hemicentin-1-like [Macrobrachium nipponense]|uniref:hemicentin-1-like n=1 Tax=Macrobrachium nipponense TaxID=159736 RepID=UPI0030C7CDCC
MRPKAWSKLVLVFLLALLVTATNAKAPVITVEEEFPFPRAFGGGGGEGARDKRRAFPGPHFHPTSPTNVTAQLGANAFLPCRIKNLGNKSVSWIRNRDSHILTVDRYTFIADERFNAWYDASTQTWTLQVRFVQLRDAGKYECQVSTEPKMSHFVQLSVITPQVSIAGESDVYVNSGSTVTIKCVITDALEEPNYIFWYHDERRVISGNTGRLLTVSRVHPDTSIGSLTIPMVSLKDSGNYTCAPASLNPASVMLHVLIGEHPAAMQRGTNTAPPATVPNNSTDTCKASSASVISACVLLLRLTSWFKGMST